LRRGKASSGSGENQPERLARRAKRRSLGVAGARGVAHFDADQEFARMGSPADYTIIVLVVALGVGLWTLMDRVGQLQRDVDALKRKIGVDEPPSVGGA
jgi:hypothetical protein